jgi:hypothetical protein
MAVTSTYKLSGGGRGGRAATADSVSLTYTTDDGGLSITLDNSFSPFTGTRQLSGIDLTVSTRQLVSTNINVPHPTPAGSTLEVSGTLTIELPVRTAQTEQLGINLFLDSAEPSAASAQSQATGVAVFTLPGSPPTLRAVMLNGTVSATDTGDGRGTAR